ncbi:SDR family oxidoreductase [Nocardia sp. NPDC051833]|uniref:SDR family oxidoreductase n=1 Tax=Nocardia sp. NPDC051833 TaxID=3155674 RepID=UPI00341994C1
MSLLTHYPPIDLRGAVVAVTGGARGIGRATAALFAARGAAVTIGDLDAVTVETTAKEIGSRGAVLDVTSRASIDDFLAAAGPVDILVNNAGIMPLGTFLDEPTNISAAQINVNFWGPIHGMQAALPGMIERGRGHIVNVASLAGKMPTPGGAVYCGTKHAVVGLSTSVRAEVAEHGVSVSTVMPSLVHTDLGSGASLPSALSLEPEDVARAIVDSVRHRRAEVVLPRWLGAAVDVTRVLPGAVVDTTLRVGGLRDRGLAANDSAERAEYRRRLAGQAQRS